ncbi:THR4p Threonine synthase [Saccharomyces cerevisiae]|nr:THR4p Threonine synthase [Saccharomyces boulardii (nom. inval.)]
MYSPNLATLIGMQTGSVNDAVYSIYKYILINNLFVTEQTEAQDGSNDAEDSNSLLQKVLDTNARLPLMNVVQTVNKLVSPLPPIILDYTIDLSKDTTYGATTLDVDVSHILHQPQPQPNLQKEEETDAEDTAKLREITKLALQLNSSAQKYQFFHELSLHPRETLTHYLWSSKQNELVLQGDQYFNEDAARTSDIYSLATDGGLFIPPTIPQVDQATLFNDWSKLSFQDLAFAIMRLYIAQEEIPDADLKDLIKRSYSTFRSDEVTPLVQNVTGDKENLHILELFHGPTYAFKDVALQFVAIYGLRGKKDVSVFILYPTGRISPIQEEQMTTVPDENVQTLSVTGTFDNCQDIVKAIFGDKEFNSKHNVGAVNSINWARILAQMTYYFYSFFQATTVRTPRRSSSLCQVGTSVIYWPVILPRKWVCLLKNWPSATNENDILDRFLKSANGDDLKAGEIVNNWFQELKTNGKFQVDKSIIEGASKDFTSERVSNEETSETIKKIYESSVNPKHYILDPHTAVGVCATERLIAKDNDKSIQYISLSTAHPAKFADAVNNALSGFPNYSLKRMFLPEELKKLSTLKKKLKFIERADVELVKNAIEEELAK